jgi:hypothetical protein
MSLWRPCSVGAMEPVGMTNASASNVRNIKARMKAMATDSTVSRKVRAQAEGSRKVASMEAFVELGFLLMRIALKDVIANRFAGTSPGAQPGVGKGCGWSYLMEFVWEVGI